MSEAAIFFKALSGKTLEVSAKNEGSLFDSKFIIAEVGHTDGYRWVQLNMDYDDAVNLAKCILEVVRNLEECTSP